MERQELMRLKKLIERLNADVYNPVGLNIVWPHPVAFLYVCTPFILSHMVSNK